LQEESHSSVLKKARLSESAEQDNKPTSSRAEEYAGVEDEDEGFSENENFILVVIDNDFES
jgi:hypothetical protein